jgi:hypothetical protein
MSPQGVHHRRDGSRVAEVLCRERTVRSHSIIRDRTIGQVMTILQAAALRVKWKQRVDPPCKHLNLELTSSQLNSCLVFWLFSKRGVHRA